MKVLIDTNILISAILNPDGSPSKAFFKAVTHPNKGLLCEQNLDELRRVFNRKFSTKLSALETFLASALTTIEVVPVPNREYAFETSVRDMTDRLTLRASIRADVDILLTGDKDFLESGIKRPRIMTASEFIKF